MTPPKDGAQETLPDRDGYRGGVFADSPPPDSREALLRENAKLRKINQVLMDRVERSMDHQGNAFSLFQTAIVLENRIRERTQALGHAMRELENTNRALTTAKTEAETAQTRLAEAIETVSDGFLLCNGDDRIVVFNTKFKAIWGPIAELVQPGAEFRTFLEGAADAGLIRACDWWDMRAAHQQAPEEPMIVQLSTGTWLRISERPTRDGGIVGIYSDITEIKLAEQRQREAELAEKSALLQATLDTITQGISVFDRDLTLVASNRQFTDLLAIPTDHVPLGTPLAALRSHPGVRIQLQPDPDTGEPPLLALEQGQPIRPAVMEFRNVSGRILEIRRNPMPGGGFVSTYTDITDRSRAAEALRDSERRLRLITDAMPALIAYVDSDRRYRFTNRAYEDWFGRPRSEINGRTMVDALGESLYGKRRAFVDLALRGEGVTFEMRLPTDKNAVEYAHATYVPHVDKSGRVLGFFALIQDVTERKRAAHSLQEAKENLERRVEERTTALLDLNEELRQAKAAADSANLSKTKFLAAASHDLLQPLNAARVFAAALSERPLGGKELDTLGHLSTALEAVDDLLSSLLEISRLEAGVLTPELSDFPIKSLLQPLAAEYGPLVRGKGLRLRVRCGGAVVFSDPKLVSRVLRNFLSNALRYTEQGGLLLGCRAGRDGLLVGVWDTGIGIPANKLTEIFEEFRRLKQERSPTDNGVGLGLAIVERIAAGLGHEVVVRSTPGRGSFFGLKIPYGTWRATPAPAAQKPVVPGGQVSGRRILVIDNEAAILEGMNALLGGWGCTVETAIGIPAVKALLEMQTVPPDLIIADYHLDDGTTGLEALGLIRRGWPDEAIPGLVVTADRTPEVAQDVKDSDCELMTKPLRPARLRAMMTHLLSDNVAQ